MSKSFFGRPAIAIGIAGALVIGSVSTTFATPVLSNTAAVRSAQSAHMIDVRWRGGAVAAGIAAGLAVGAIAGAAASGPYYGPYYGGPAYYGPAYPAPVYVDPGPGYYDPGPVYVAPAPYGYYGRSGGPNRSQMERSN